MNPTNRAVLSEAVADALAEGRPVAALESLCVCVLGYRTKRFPGIYLTDAGRDIDWRVGFSESPSLRVSVSPCTRLADGCPPALNPHHSTLT